MAVKDSTLTQVLRSLSPNQLRKIKLALLAIGLFLFYAVGVFFRSSRGIHVTVQNDSGMSLKDAIIMIDKGESLLLGEIAAGKTKKTFIVPASDSSIRLEFAVQKGQRQSQIVAGYVENGYCGDVIVRVLPGFGIKSHDNSFAMRNWKSWYGFL